MGTSGDQIWPFASQPFMRSPGPLTLGKTEEWHLGIHAILEEVAPEEQIVWRIQNDGVDGDARVLPGERGQGDAC